MPAARAFRIVFISLASLSAISAVASAKSDPGGAGEGLNPGTYEDTRDRTTGEIGGPDIALTVRREGVEKPLELKIARAIIGRSEPVAVDEAPGAVVVAAVVRDCHARYRWQPDQRDACYRQMYKWAERYRKGEGVEKDPAKAVELYRIVAETGNVWAKYQLAESYRKGEGIEKDPARAVELYRIAAETGNVWAKYQLAESYRKGEGVEKDPAKAVELYRLAAAAGNAWAQYGLAESYRKGEGVEKDMEQAGEWYRKAAQQGHDNAKKRLRDIAGSSQ